jgi:hypothetical protein
MGGLIQHLAHKTSQSCSRAHYDHHPHHNRELDITNEMAPPTAENMFAQLGRKRRIHPAEEVTTVETTQLKVLEAMDETSDIANSKNSFLPKEAYTEKSSQIFPQGPELAERQLCAATDLVGDYHANNGECSV